MCQALRAHYLTNTPRRLQLDVFYDLHFVGKDEQVTRSHMISKGKRKDLNSVHLTLKPTLSIKPGCSKKDIKRVLEYPMADATISLSLFSFHTCLVTRIGSHENDVNIPLKLHWITVNFPWQVPFCATK